jgi:hypothetical protein
MHNHDGIHTMTDEQKVWICAYSAWIAGRAGHGIRDTEAAKVADEAVKAFHGRIRDTEAALVTMLRADLDRMQAKIAALTEEIARMGKGINEAS